MAISIPKTPREIQADTYSKILLDIAISICVLIKLCLNEYI
jgi:hypothetical protein